MSLRSSRFGHQVWEHSQRPQPGRSQHLRPRAICRSKCWKRNAEDGQEDEPDAKKLDATTSPPKKSTQREKEKKESRWKRRDRK